MAYDPKKDEILWQGGKREFKPKATLEAQVKSYQNGEPKLTLVEEGEGFRGKTYTGYILKRIGIDDINMIKDMIEQAYPELLKRYDEWKQKKIKE